MTATTVWAFPIVWPDPEPCTKADRQGRVLQQGYHLPRPTSPHKAMVNQMFLRLMQDGELHVDNDQQENMRSSFRARLRMNQRAERLHYESGPNQCRFYLKT